MAINIYLDSTTHNFQKQNLVTLTDRQGCYDEMLCSTCGLKGKRRALNTVVIYGRTKATSECGKSAKAAPKPAGTGVQIRITDDGHLCEMCSSLTKGTSHRVVEPPLEAKDAAEGDGTDRGYWVLGERMPVLVLFEECEVLV